MLPISTVGEILAAKNAQKKAKKNIISETINKIANIEPVGSKFAIYEEFEEWIELDNEESIEILSSGKKIVDKPLED